MKKRLFSFLLALSLVMSMSAFWFHFSASAQAQDSVSQYGITWYFSEAKPCGQFADGSWWVVGPVTITRITPECTTVDGVTMHGSMLNPVNAEFTHAHGFDSRPEYNTYVESLNAARTMPLYVPAGSSLLSCESYVETRGPQIKTTAILTVLDAPAPDGSFRPPYMLKDKTIRWNKSDLDYSILRRLPKPSGNQYTPAEVAAKLERPWIEINPDWSGSHILPDLHYRTMTDTSGTYGREMTAMMGYAALTLQLDYTDEEKEDLLIYTVQRGLDIYGAAKEGATWSANGGHSQGRKLPLLMAGAVLHDDDIMEYGDAEKHFIFHEDQAHFYVSMTDVEIPRLPVNPMYSPLGPYTVDMIGMPEWSVGHYSNAAGDGSNLDKAYRDNNGAGGTATVLAARLMGLEDAWNRPVFFDYLDRYAEIINTGAFSPPNGTPPFFTAMWKAYRHYDPVANTVITTNSALPDGMVGIHYAKTIEMTGGTPVTWSVTGDIPPGMTIGTNSTGIYKIMGRSTVIVGKPTTPGTYNFTVTATSRIGEGSTATNPISPPYSKAFIITIAENDRPFNKVETTDPAATTTPTPFEVPINAAGAIQKSIFYQKFDGSAAHSSGTQDKWNRNNTHPLVNLSGSLGVLGRRDSDVSAVDAMGKGFLNLAGAVMLEARQRIPEHWTNPNGWFAANMSATGVINTSSLYNIKRNGDVYDIYFGNQTSNPIASVSPGEWFTLRAAIEPNRSANTLADMWSNTTLTVFVEVEGSPEVKRKGTVNITHNEFWGTRGTDLALYLLINNTKGYTTTLQMDYIDLYSVVNCVDPEPQVVYTAASTTPTDQKTEAIKLTFANPMPGLRLSEISLVSEEDMSVTTDSLEAVPDTESKEYILHISGVDREGIAQITVSRYAASHTPVIINLYHEPAPEFLLSGLSLYKEGGDYKVSCHVSNPLAVDKDVDFIVAVYNGDKLMDVSIIPESVEASYSYTLYFVYTPGISLLPQYTIKVMAWQNTQEPLCAAYVKLISEI